MSVPAARLAPKGRVMLGNDKAEKVAGPFYTLLFGVEGIGKSTFGSECPASKVIDLENRTGHIKIARVPTPDGGWTWPDVLDAIRLFETESHDRKTLVIDTLDELEALLWAFICKRDSKTNIEAYGYGKGYQAAIDEWRVFVSALERLRARRGMNLLLTAHCIVKTFKNPEGPDFDRYQPKLHDKAAGYLKARVYDVLFAMNETFSIKEDEKDRKGKATDTGKRVMYTTRTAAHDGKNSHALPDILPFSAAEYVKAVQDFYALGDGELHARCEDAIPKMRPALQEEAKGLLSRADTDLKLGQLLGWIRNNAA